MAKTTVNAAGRTVPAQEFDPVRVRDISTAVYKERLESESGKGAVEREMKRTPRGSTKPLGEEGVREHAGMYDTLTRCYLRALGVK